MTEKLHFLPVDLRIHKSQVIDLNMEHMTWVLKESAALRDLVATSAISIQEHVTSVVEKLCSDVPPHGIYYLLELEGTIIGMGAVHEIKEKIGEIKRMYILPTYRGKGYGKALLKQLLKKAKEFGYEAVYLDTARFMTAAQHIYRSSGFIERNPYPETEVPPQLWPHWLFMEKTLDTTK
jgi:N-acetylglutamate synthase-like GNAT family acetyltransferase